MKACIVTCGGLCPGINTVIREIVCGLWTQYGVREIFGIDVSESISQIIGRCEVFAQFLHRLRSLCTNFGYLLSNRLLPID